MILAHRGDSFHAPENTLEAAGLGHLAGADGWELDVRLTRDGVPVVLHDESLIRTTDVARRFQGDPRGDRGFLVGDFTLEEVRSLDAGSWFVEPFGGPRSAADFGTLGRLPGARRDLYASGAVRVPTLVEALDWSRTLDWLVNVEIKPTPGDPSAQVVAVLNAIGSTDMVDHATVSSFDLAVVAEVASRQPGLATGALVSGPVDPDRVVGFLATLGAYALHAPPFGLPPMSAGVPVLVYTVNDAGPGGLAGRLADEGVAGLFTDDPASLTDGRPITPSSARTRPRWETAGRPSGGR